MNESLVQFSRVHPSERILLLPHCLRKSNHCRATYDQYGLQCLKCSPDCAINLLRSAAIEAGYKNVCVAPGGRLAVKFVEENQPEAIVAVACEKELQKGVQGVKELPEMEITPIIVIIPLIRDGCVDTQVDIKEALKIINAGCMEMIRNK